VFYLFVLKERTVNSQLRALQRIFSAAYVKNDNQEIEQHVTPDSGSGSPAKNSVSVNLALLPIS